MGTPIRRRGRAPGRGMYLALAAAATLALGVASCGDDDGGDGGQTGEGGADVESAVFALPGDIVNTDPANNYDYNTATVGQQWCEPLLRMDAEGQLEPNLATEWEQPDDTTYVYTLRDDVLFHDGTEMTPEDVKFSLDRHRDKDLGSFLAQFHERVDSVEVTGENEVTVTLSEPDAMFQYAVATQAGHVVSEDFVRKNGDENGLLSDPKAGVVCTGPYQFESWTPGESIEMSAFPDYWDGEPAIKNVEFQVIEDEQTLVSALNSGEVDGAINAPSGQAAQTLGDSVNLLTGPSTNASSIAVNTQRPPFDDVKVRQALSYALDKEGIGQSAYGGFTDETKAPAMPSLWTYSEDTFETAYDELPGFEQDIEQAKQLISEAGAEGASAELLVSTPVDEEVALAVQDAASEIGLDISPRKVPFNQKTALEYADGNKEFDATLLTWGSDFPDPIGNMFFPFNSNFPVTNVVQYDNPEVDRALETARSSIDDQERADALVEAQSQIVEDQAWIVYAWPDVLMPLNTRLATDYEPNGFWYFQDWLAQISGAE